ncbi:MAG: DNA-binding response regulator [Rhodocyclaceae bacterium]|nr:MAG: DNA-binding response regulator [Rhodocyclaceae bacterium]
MTYSESRKARIIIVDDHPIVRQGVAMLINQEPEMQACCEAGDIEEAMKANQSCPHDMAIVDLSLLGISGLELVKQFRSKYPSMAILVMSMHDETVYAERVLRAGAQGYLMKHEGTDTVLQAIRQILNGEHYISNRMRSRMIKQLVQGQKEDSPIRGLTASEFEVLHLIGMGLENSDIAVKLARSVKTVESHRANIRKKLNLSSGNELTYYAYNWVRENGNIK